MKKPPKRTSRKPPEPRWRLYAFRDEPGSGWTLVAGAGGEAADRALASSRFGAITDWRPVNRHYRPSHQTEGLVLVREDDAYDVSRRPDETSHVWDFTARTWRAHGEPLDPPPYSEHSNHVRVEFDQPDIGWIEFRIRSEKQLLKIALSEVFDPFDNDFTLWLERIVKERYASITINVEGSLARIDVLPSTDGFVYVVARPTYVGHREFIVETPRRAFVSDFYSSLVSFWEGDELKANWWDWLYMMKNDPEQQEECPPEARQPWPIRSEIVERYLAEGGT